MKKTCTQCSAEFQITDEDLEFYDKISPVFAGKKYAIPSPTLCPPCRQQRRLTFRNEKTLHHRKCDQSGKEIISMYSSEKPFPVYDQEIWWSDNWDPLKYGKEIDFTKSFFEQLSDLQHAVPRMSLNVIHNKNSYYTNYALRNKDSYLIYTADDNEDCYYGRFSDRNKNCANFDFTYDSHFCYETVEVHKCNQCFYSQKCTECSDVYFCYDLRNCHNCIFCANLRNKKYHVFNKPVSKEEFEKIKNDFQSAKIVQMARKKADEFFCALPHKNLENINCEECIGDYLQNSKNAQYAFDAYDLHDVKYISHLFDVQDSYDWDFIGGKSELCYEMCSSAHRINHCAFSMHCWDGNNDLYYCDLCIGVKNCFGCIGLRKKEYCILNKQYTKQEYEQLVPKIIEYMDQIGEWGEFFPVSISPFGYNESVAYEYFPLTKEETVERGWKWHDTKEEISGSRETNIQIPDKNEDVNDSICDQVLVCEETGKPFKIIPQELKYHQMMKIPLPRISPDARHKRRMKQKNPRKLWKSTCQKCAIDIWTSYDPVKQIPVYCEKCYLKAVD